MAASKSQKLSLQGAARVTTLFSLNFAKNQEPYFVSIKFHDFERKLELECIKFRDFFYSSMCSFDLRTVTT